MRVIIVGGGIVGLATACRLIERFADIDVTILEKEDRVADVIRSRNGEIHLGAKVTRFETASREIRVSVGDQEFATDYAINCGGLHCNRIEKLADVTPSAQIVPFLGEYFELEPSAEHLCQGLIYPTPDPSFPFLGVHFTRMIQGGVECGPNAVLAFAREGYRKSDINLRDL